MENIPNSDEIFATLKNDILTLQLKPGQHMSEHALCEQFGVSRTPIRSTLQRLQDMGLVDIVPYKGIFVTKLDYGLIDQIIYQRIALESFVMRDFIRINSPAEHEAVRFALHLLHEEGDKFLIKKDEFSFYRFLERDFQMHEIWFKAINKPYLATNLERPNASYTRFCMLDIAIGENVPYVLADHDEMLQIIENGDEAAIEPLLRRHLYGNIRRLGSRLFTDFRDLFIEETLLL